MSNQLGNLIKISTTIVGVILATIAPLKIVNNSVLALPPETVSKIVKKSTVRIDGEENGSGVILGKDGDSYIVLTNLHVVDSRGEYTISTTDGESHPIENTVRLKQGVDLALVYFESDNDYKIIEKGNSDALIEGQLIYIAGYPSLKKNHNRTYSFTSVSLFGFLDTLDITERQGYELIYDGQATPGLSGSPIVNKEAQLIGIYGLSESEVIGDIEGAPLLSTRLLGIPINTALKLTAREGIYIGESEPISSPATIDSSFAINNVNAGFEIQGSSKINSFVIPEIVYTGECPGKEIQSQKAMFFSNSTATASDRRVIITNITRGLDRDPLPYTDREYQREQVSEVTKVTLGLEHKKRNFVVLPGNNKFKYEIVQVDEDKDLETVLEEGTFSASVETTETFVERNKEPKEETYCPDDKFICESEDLLVRVVDKCPK